MLVDLNVSVGNFSTSKKSASFRWASSLPSTVLTLAAGINTSTVE
jgi:hypothetical protein